MGITVDTISDGLPSFSYSGITIPDNVKIKDFVMERLEGCTKCTLHNSRTNIVYYRGNPKGKILIIGEA